MTLPLFVIPAKAGIHNHCRHGSIEPSKIMDPRLRGDDVEFRRYV
jgi:hypothetical protein